MAFSQKGGQPLILSHRGSSALERENTIAAFRRGINEGASGVELDVWQCGSGEIVVHHNEVVPTLGRIHQASLADIKLFTRYEIPTLIEVLASLNPTVINVEIKSSKSRGIKSNPQKVLNALIPIASRYSLKHRLVFSTFDYRFAVNFTQLYKFGSTAIVVGYRNSISRSIAFCTENSISAIYLNYRRVTAEVVKRISQAQLGLGVWTVDDPDAIASLLRLGVGVIITNDVPMAVSLVNTGSS